MDQIQDPRVSESDWIRDLSIRQALDRLGPRERSIITERFFEGKTQMEVAGEIGISQAQVSRLEKAALQQTIYKTGYKPTDAELAAAGMSRKEAEDWAAALLEAYLPFYKDAEPIIFENDGVSSVKITNPYATGKNEDGIVPDRVFVLLRDAAGNYFEPMSFEVPDLFK
jgi:hypothetical protein